MRDSDASPEDTQNLPAQSQGDIEGEIVEVDTEWNAPLPSPIDFQRYEDTLPGTANRILGMAETEQSYQHIQQMAQYEQEMTALEVIRADVVEGSRKSYLGMALGFIIAMTGIGCGTYLAASGHDVSGMTFLVASLASLVGVSIYGIRSQSAERRRDAEED